MNADLFQMFTRESTMNWAAQCNLVSQTWMEGLHLPSGGHVYELCMILGYRCVKCCTVLPHLKQHLYLETLPMPGVYTTPGTHCDSSNEQCETIHSKGGPGSYGYDIWSRETNYSSINSPRGLLRGGLSGRESTLQNSFLNQISWKFFMWLLN